jgi:hypothetical protein
MKWRGVFLLFLLWYPFYLFVLARCLIIILENKNTMKKGSNPPPPENATRPAPPPAPPLPRTSPAPYIPGLVISRKTASELLLQSALPFDTACMLVREIEAVLDRIISLDRYADKNGRDDYFERELRAIFNISNHVMTREKI